MLARQQYLHKPHCSRSQRRGCAPGSRYNDKGVFHLSIRSFLRLSAHIQMLPVLESGEETLVGGQAVMEGVMMRAPHSYCVAVRKPNGEIVTEAEPAAARFREISDLQAARFCAAWARSATPCIWA